MISIPGNKTFTATAIICCMSVGLMLGAILSQRQSSIKLYEKKLEKTISSINERNMKETAFENHISIDGSKRK